MKLNKEIYFFILPFFIFYVLNKKFLKILLKVVCILIGFSMLHTFFFTRAYLFSSDEGWCYIVLQTIVTNFAHLIVAIYKTFKTYSSYIIKMALKIIFYFNHLFDCVETNPFSVFHQWSKLQLLIISKTLINFLSKVTLISNKVVVLLLAMFVRKKKNHKN